ncbi:iron ABC transporter permease, partial [Vibrio anguillarum]|nr:iron ABC transporter permease [Vibrio anguillarum]
MKIQKYRMAWLVGIAAMLFAFSMSLQFGAVPLTWNDVLVGLLSFNDEEIS